VPGKYKKKSLKMQEFVNRKTDNKIAKWKRTSNDIQSTTQKTKDRATRTPQKKRGWTFDLNNYFLMVCNTIVSRNIDRIPNRHYTMDK